MDRSRPKCPLCARTLPKHIEIAEADLEAYLAQKPKQGRASRNNLHALALKYDCSVHYIYRAVQRYKEKRNASRS